MNWMRKGLMSGRMAATLSILSVVVIAGCGGSSGGVCTPNATKTCGCSNKALTGSSRCAADGSKWGGCICVYVSPDASQADAAIEDVGPVSDPGATDPGSPADPGTVDPGAVDPGATPDTADEDATSPDPGISPDVTIDDVAEDPGAPGDPGIGTDPGVEPDPGVVDPGPQDPGTVDTAGGDSDGDGVPDSIDNCPDDKNAGQENHDTDAAGDACDPDDDGDGVPDATDEAPLDPAWPGFAEPGTIYAHTSTKLFRWKPGPAVPLLVAAFGFPADGGNHEMTDIAIDRDGRLFATSFDRLYRCSAVSGACVTLATLATAFNGLTLVPKGTIDATADRLVAIGQDGSWNLVDLQGSQALLMTLGKYGADYTSSGDAYSIEGVGTFASVNKTGEGDDVLVRVDPATGKVEAEIGVLTGYQSVFGMAGFGGRAYGFDMTGAIVSLDLTTGAVAVEIPANLGQPWWGAAVSTRNPDMDTN